MGFFKNLFGKLFGGKQTEEAAVRTPSTEGYVIDIRGDCFIINGTRIEVPTHIDKLTAVLGKPRAEKFKNKPGDKEFFERTEHEQVTKRVNYMWDELGLKAYTLNGSVVNTFEIEFKKADYETKRSATKTKFKGTVTVNGNPWFGEIMAGKDFEVFRRRIVGNYSLTAEYADFEQDDDTRTENDFTGIEIQLGTEDDPFFSDDIMEDEDSEDAASGII